MEFNADKYKIFDNILKNENYQNDEIIEVIGKALSSCCPRSWNRIDKILLNIINFNEEELKKECYKGLPDDLPSLRALIWKINFRYLPHDIHKWKDSLQSKRNEYLEIKNAFILRIKEEIKIFEELEKEKKKKNNSNKNNDDIQDEEKIDEPEKDNNIINDENNNDIQSNEGTLSSLSSLAQCTDRNLLETINKDINRTRMNMHFFNHLVNNKNISDEEISNIIFQKRNCTYQNYKQVYTKGREKINIFENETHSDVIERIIYIYCKLHKEVGYVQGMNELVAPIYYCFSIDNTVSLENVEADTFWSFTFLMKDIKKLFLKENDNLKGGIIDRVFTLDLLMKNLQKDTYSILAKNHVNIFHFAFSWINVFFCQEFLMPDIIRLWDIIFSEKDRFIFVYFFSMAILQIKKEKIEHMDFCNIVEEMKKFEDENVEQIIEVAILLKKKYEKKANEIISNNDKKETNNELMIKCQNHLGK
jgi:hypothetical protein